MKRITDRQRDLYIDLARGICVISIIFIHTVFWSGSSYVPNWVRNLSLLVDVPLFFFLTGCTMSIYSKLNPLKQILKLALLFFFTVAICQIIYLNFNLKNLIAPLILGDAKVPHVPLLKGSYWFVPVYAVSILYTKIILDYLKPVIVNSFMYLIPIFYIYLFFSHSTYNYPAVFQGVSCQQVLFHLWLILLGLKTYNLNKKYIWLGLSLFCIVGTIAFALNEPSFYLQSYKFPTSLPYIVATMISIGAVMAFKKTVKQQNFLTFLGENAISFYLAQCISSSILFNFVRIININWIYKLAICFSLNFLMAMIIGFLITKLTPKITSIITK